LQRAELKKARIEIIPMIDTIFFLLVFFMYLCFNLVSMSAPRLNMPVSGTSHDKPQEKVVISMSREGQYYMDKVPVAYEDILPMLKDKIAENPNYVIILNVDRDQNVGEFKRVMADAQAANPAQLEIATEPRGGDAQ
jgi:biopolymer transport protein ExbD